MSNGNQTESILKQKSLCCGKYRHSRLISLTLLYVPVDPIQEQVVRWTVRVSVAFYLAYLLVASTSPQEPRTSLLRAIWSLGLAFFLLHLIAAFEFVHHWSHQNAWDHTAEQTYKMTGLRWGGGVYFNYLFALIWCFDVVLWWWKGSQWRTNHRSYRYVVHFYFAFIVFNATVVFGPPFWRYIAVGTGLCLALTLLLNRSKHSANHSGQQV